MVGMGIRFDCWVRWVLGGEVDLMVHVRSTGEIVLGLAVTNAGEELKDGTYIVVMEVLMERLDWRTFA